MRSLIILVIATATAHADSDTHEYYGYETVIGGVAVAGLGVWSSEADMTRDNHVAAATLLLVGGFSVGPLVNWGNDGYRLEKLRHSSQLAGGGAALGFILGAGLELSAYDKDSTHSFDWSRVGAFTFAGLGVGAIVDGIVLGYTSAGPPDKFQLVVVPTQNGGAVSLGGRF